MLLCCSNETLAATGVQEEIEIGLDLAKELKDNKFLIPLRIKPYKKLFGIGGLQYIDFVRGWAEGLDKLLETLKRQKVPCRSNGVIQPGWELHRRRGAVILKDEPERLTSNWLRISEAPNVINYFEPSGVIDRDALASAADVLPEIPAIDKLGPSKGDGPCGGAVSLKIRLLRCFPSTRQGSRRRSCAASTGSATRPSISGRPSLAA
jgi:hypothetical protein